MYNLKPQIEIHPVETELLVVTDGQTDKHTRIDNLYSIHTEYSILCMYLFQFSFGVSEINKCQREYRTHIAEY